MVEGSVGTVGTVGGSVGTVVGIVGIVVAIVGGVVGMVVGIVGRVVGAVVGSVVGTVGIVVGNVVGKVVGSEGQVVGTVEVVGRITETVGTEPVAGGRVGRTSGPGSVMGTGSTSIKIIASSRVQAVTAMCLVIKNILLGCNNLPLYRKNAINATI